MEGKLVLQMDSIVKTFPGVKALDGVHLGMRRGEVHTLCGENGAGKSTLMRIIAGAQGYTSEHMYVSGEEVVFRSARDAEREGTTMICQEFNMVRNLSVAENMYLERLPKTPCGAIDWKKLYRDAQEELNRLGLKFDCRTKVWNLSVAESQVTEIAKCLTISARVIIMDEPTATLIDEKICTLFRTAAELKAGSISILYIPHRMDEVFQISDRLTVFRDGKYITTKDIGDTNYDEVVSMMARHSVTNLYLERGYTQGGTVFKPKDICGRGIHSVNIRLHKDEILEVAELLGPGTIELPKIVYGTLPMGPGGIYINGERKDYSGPKKALKAGIGFVSDDKKQEGLVLIRNIRENVSLSPLDKIAHFIHLDKRLEAKQINVQIKRLNTEIGSPQQLAGKFSGGNQQKVVFAKVLEASPSVLILDKSTRNVDVGTKAEIYQIIDGFTRAGKGIILISTNLPEVIGMSDRVIVMREGHTVLEMPELEMNQEIILAHASRGVSKNEQYK